MLPLVIKEEQIFAFKFWFNGTIRNGMYYQNELFCRLETFDASKRPQVYQLGCKLAQKNVLVALSSSTQTCSLWGSLRSPMVKKILLNPAILNLPNPAGTAATTTQSNNS